MSKAKRVAKKYQEKASKIISSVRDKAKPILEKAKPAIDKYIPQSRQFLEGVAKKLGRKEFIAGIDIGTSSVKIAQFKKLDRGLLLVYSNLVEIDQDTNQDKGLNAKQAAFNKALGGIDLKKTEIICVVNCPGTYTLELNVPFMSQSELAEAVKWEARKLIPFIAEETEVDFQILEQAEQNGEKTAANKLKVLVSISPKKTIEETLNLLNQLMIKPIAIIPVPIAINNLIEKQDFGKDETLAVLDIGASITELVIFKARNPVFNRKLPITGMDFTASLNTTLESDKGRVQLDLRDAERIKRLVGIPKAGAGELIEQKVSSTQVLSLLRPVLERLSVQINQSFDYYREHWAGASINRLIIYGGGARLKGLAEFLSSELGIRVDLGSPLKGIDKSEGALKQEDSLQIGMAIAAALNPTGGVNLLPEELKTSMQKTVRAASVKAGATAIGLILLFAYIGMRIQLSNLDKKIAAQNIYYKAVGSQVQDAKEQVQIHNLISKQPLWEEVFRELTNILPDNLYLTSMLVDSDIIILKGRIVSVGPRLEEALSRFMVSLEDGIFKEVSLVSTKKKNEPFESLEFEIKCQAE